MAPIVNETRSGGLKAGCGYGSFLRPHIHQTCGRNGHADASSANGPLGRLGPRPRNSTPDRSDPDRAGAAIRRRWPSQPMLPSDRAVGDDRPESGRRSDRSSVDAQCAMNASRSRGGATQPSPPLPESRRRSWKTGSSASTASSQDAHARGRAAVATVRSGQARARGARPPVATERAGLLRFPPPRE